MLDSYKLTHKEIRNKIEKLEDITPKDIDEYQEREDKIRELLKLLT